MVQDAVKDDQFLTKKRVHSHGPYYRWETIQNRPKREILNTLSLGEGLTFSINEGSNTNTYYAYSATNDANNDETQFIRIKSDYIPGTVENFLWGDWLGK